MTRLTQESWFVSHDSVYSLTSLDNNIFWQRVVGVSFSANNLMYHADTWEGGN